MAHLLKKNMAGRRMMPHQNQCISLRAGTVTYMRIETGPEERDRKLAERVAHCMTHTNLKKRLNHQINDNTRLLKK
jgi:hypothetical protein